MIPIGTAVRVIDPDEFAARFAAKIAARTGNVIGHTYPDSYPIVVFPKDTKRKELRMIANDHHTFEVVS